MPSRSPRDLLHLVPRLLALLWRASPALTSAAAALTLVNAAVVPAQIWFTKVAIDRVLASLQSDTPTPDWLNLLTPIAALGAI